MTTSERSTVSGLQQMELPLTSSAEGSPARTSPAPARALASMASALAYGASIPALLASFDPATRSWRTSQRCLVEGWTLFSETWPRSGLMRNGIAYRLPPLVPLTGGTESGLLPTPEASNTKAIALRSGGREPRDFLKPLWPTPTVHGLHNQPGASEKAGWGLSSAAKLWPTPRATDGSHGGRVTPRKGREGGNLVEALSARTFATPTARDWRSGKASAETMAKNSRPLSEQIGGSLNPTWVELLMGFPPGWTDLT